LLLADGALAYADVTFKDLERPWPEWARERQDALGQF